MGQLEGDKAKERQTPKAAQGIRNRGHTTFQEQCKAEKVEGKKNKQKNKHRQGYWLAVFNSRKSNGKKVVIPDPTPTPVCVTYI